MVGGDWFDVPALWFFLMNTIFLMNLCCTGASSNICTNLCVISPRACLGQGRFTSHEDLEPENISSCFPTWQPNLTSQHTDLLAIRGPCCLWTVCICFLDMPFVFGALQVQFWSLRALQEDGNTLADSSVLPIHIHKGENYIGRMDLKNSSKQVSRKHVSITASSQGNLQIFVVGCIYIFFPLVWWIDKHCCDQATIFF